MQSILKRSHVFVGASVIAICMMWGATHVLADIAPNRGSCYAPGTPVVDDFVLGPTTPGKWGAPGMPSPGGTVTWSLMPAGTSDGGEGHPGGTFSSLGSFMPAGFKTEVIEAFDAWTAFADITFVEVPDDGVPFNASPGAGHGDIRLGGAAFDGPGGTLAHGYYPPVNGNTAAGDIHLDDAELWKIGFGGAGFDIFTVVTHEIGHAIGLDHTGVPASLMNPYYTEAFLGPQADDIAGAQFIYGIPEPTSIALLAFGGLGILCRRRR